MKSFVFAGLIFGVLIAQSASAQTLKLGSPAPALDVKAWYKGEPIKTLAKDKTYVVEFWATWCGPCRESIPHLTELAKKNPNVDFIGISIWEDDNGSNVKQFIHEMGPKMDYHIGYSGNTEGMAKSWMAAAGQNGIPTAFVVKNGLINWIGHPMEMEAPLKSILAGNFDSNAYKKELDARQDATRRQQLLQKQIPNAIALRKEGKKTEANQLLKALMQSNPQFSDQIEALQFEWLAVDNKAAWEVKAKQLATTGGQKGMRSLVIFTMGREHDHKLSEEAIELATQGAGATDFVPWFYASQVYFTSGNKAKALAATQKALGLFSKSPYTKQTQIKTLLEERLKKLGG